MKNNNVDNEIINICVNYLDDISRLYSIQYTGQELCVSNSKYAKYIDMYAASKCISGRQPSAIKNNVYILDQFFAYSQKDIDQITANDIRSFYINTK